MILRKMKHASIIIIILLFCFNGQSQSVLNPNYGLKAPLTAEIVRVDFNSDATVVWLTIMSDINNAWFCIDRNTFLIKPDGMKVKLKSLKGLPYCPRHLSLQTTGREIVLLPDISGHRTLTLVFSCGGMHRRLSLIQGCCNRWRAEQQ